MKVLMILALCVGSCVSLSAASQMESLGPNDTFRAAQLTKKEVEELVRQVEDSASIQLTIGKASCVFGAWISDVLPASSFRERNCCAVRRVIVRLGFFESSTISGFHFLLATKSQLSKDSK